jgi:hypothetical protein
VYNRIFRRSIIEHLKNIKKKEKEEEKKQRETANSSTLLLLSCEQDAQYHYC